MTADTVIGVGFIAFALVIAGLALAMWVQSRREARYWASRRHR